MLATVAKLDAARATLQAHPMCCRLQEAPGCVTVHFPPGYRADAAQMRYAMHGVSKTKAFELLLNTCEKYWQLS